MTDEEAMMADSEIKALHAHKDDPDEWDDVPSDVSVRPSPGEVVSFRIPGKELDRLQQAAEAEGVTLSEFIRDALRNKIEGKPWSSLDDVSSGVVTLILGPEWPRKRSIVSATWDQGIPVHAPLYPPESQNVTSSEGAAHTDPDEDRLPLDA